jgi:DNA-binding MarR family transcriptional regulator
VPAHLARRFHQIFLGLMAEFLAPEDLTPLLWSVMAAVQETPGRDQKHGAHHVGVDAVNFGQMIDVLEAKGLVERKTDDGDRRARKLYITERGTSLRERLSPTLRSAQERLLAPLSKAERVALVDMLVRVIEANDSYARPGNGRRKPRRAPKSEGGIGRSS